MKKMLIPFLSVFLLHTSPTYSHFSDGFIIGGLTGLTAGLVTSAVAQPCNHSEVVIIERCPLKRCFADVHHTSGCIHSPSTGAQSKRHHTKVKRQPRTRRRRGPQNLFLKKQEAALISSLDELAKIKASMQQESRRIDLMIQEMELKLKEANLRLKRS